MNFEYGILTGANLVSDNHPCGGSAIIAAAAIKRYDEISRIGRRSLTAAPGEYNWQTMLATGRNNYGTPEQCINNINNARKNYYFDTLTTTFNFGGIPHAEILKSMRLFAKEVMPAFRS